MIGLDSHLAFPGLDEPLAAPAPTHRLGYIRIPGVVTLSYSKLLNLHNCQRLFYLNDMNAGKLDPANVHTTYGHTFAGAIQEYFRSQSKERAIVAMLSHWAVDLEDEIAKDKKSLWLAVHQFEMWLEHVAPVLLDEWEHFPGGIEPLFLLKISQRYCYQGHIDLILRRKRDGKLGVFEIKTTTKDVTEATYSNSMQTGGYTLVVDAIAAQHDTQNSYEVVYLVANPKHMFSPEDNWGLCVLPFVRSTRDKIEFLHTVLLDCEQIERYRQADFWPKRGEHCRSFNRTCRYYGSCDMTALDMLAGQTAAYTWLSEADADYVIELDPLIEQLLSKQEEAPLEHLDGLSFD